MIKNKNNQAFTLVELSIVLVIVGLLIGGTLAGKELIEVAQAHKVVSGVENYVTAYNTFFLKYNAKPGDFERASSFLTGASNGDGDGKIYSTTGDFDMAEMSYAWNHLFLAGIIKQYYPGTIPGGTLECNDLCPAVYYKTMGFWYQNVWRSFYTIRSTDDFLIPGDRTTLLLMSSTEHWDTFRLPTATAMRIDSKLDDGLPSKGKVFAINPVGRTDGCTDTDFDTSTNTATWVEDDECGLIFWLN